jgi:hypothetical protein
MPRPGIHLPLRTIRVGERVKIRQKKPPSAPALKRIAKSTLFSGALKALLPPHECGGSHQETCDARAYDFC